jgi:6,7-dimethyl-8-ribityllumazine synthase
VSLRIIRPDHDATGLRFGLVASRFNEKHVQRLVDGALETLRRQGAADDDLELWWVPGALELPLAAKWLARLYRTRGEGGWQFSPHAILAFGVVIRGQTEHFRLVADQCARGLLDVSLELKLPVLDGVLACHDAEQVEARLGGAVGHTGVSTALAAIQMARLGATQKTWPATAGESA